MARQPTTTPQSRGTTDVGPAGRVRRLDRRALGGLCAWKLEDAKARFSEVVRRARTEGPQRVTYRGEDAVVVIVVDELAGLLPEREGEGRPNLVAFLRGTALGELDLRREEDRGREPPL